MYFYGGELLSEVTTDSSQEQPLDLSTKKVQIDTKSFIYPTSKTPEGNAFQFFTQQTPSDSARIPMEVRPFKAYQRNPLSIMSMIPLTTEENDSKTMEEKYRRFRDASLGKLKPRSASNQNMRRTSQCKQHEDPMYREKREKNNLAAKRSRDARKMREDELTIRVAFLEAELIKSKTLNDQDRTVLQTIRNKIEERKLMVSQQNDRLDQLKQVYFYELNNISKARG